jgi:hypothetical protein
MTAAARPDLGQGRRDPAQGLPDSGARLVAGPEPNQSPDVIPGASETSEPGFQTRCEKTQENTMLWARGIPREQCAMKLFMEWAVSAGLVFTAVAANAQAPARYEIGRPPVTRVSDVGGSYAAVPPEGPVPGYGPRLLPPREVTSIVRESGFSPLGMPQQRGLVYTISVIDRGGDDGRLVIDARSGRIIRFTPAYRMGDNFNEDLNSAYGPVGPLPPPTNIGYRRAPRPPLPIPHVASRSATPLPKPPPHLARPEAPAQQSAASAKPAELQASPPSPTVGVAKPSVQIMPTQGMPKAQGLD